MLGLYRKEAHRNFFRSILGHMRDIFVNFLPVRRLPAFLVKILYGVHPDFIFLIHPRRVEDILIGVPYFKMLRKILPAKVFLWLIARTPTYVVGKMHSEQGINGLLVTNAILPKYMMKNRKKTLQNIKSIMRFIAKISKKSCYLGLGAWWPIVSRRGLVFKGYAGGDIAWCITNGHCGTLVSIYLTVDKIADLWGVDTKDINIAILGSGKMGTAVARSFLGKVRKITLIDKNIMRLNRTFRELSGRNAETEIEAHHVKAMRGLEEILSRNDIGICTTSNITPLLHGFEIPENFIIIDDSRPEAFHRTTNKKNSIVLEGGLIKIKGFNVDYDFGFGIDDNVFGCLAEAFVLALDGGKTISPTLGDVEFDNFNRIMDFYRENNIKVGDFKSGDIVIDDEDIKHIHRNKVALAKRGKN